MNLNIDKLREMSTYEREEAVHCNSTSYSHVITWCPGNGTKYTFMIVGFEHDQALMLSVNLNAAMVMVLDHDGWVAVPLGGGKIAHVSYVAQKIGSKVSEEKVKAVAAVANILLPQCDTDYGVELAREIMSLR